MISEGAALSKARALLRSAKHRAKVKGLPFGLAGEVESIAKQIQCGCALSGLQFSIDHLGETPKESYRVALSPSLDRIDREKGYIKGNVRVICWALNCAFNTYGEEVVRSIMYSWITRST